MAKRKSNDITKIIAAVAVLIAALIWLFDTFFSDKSGDNAFNAPVESISSQVTFVDVGQGDATLVVSGSEAMLIDTGERDSDNTLLKYLEEHNIDSLKYLVITHPHTDHMGEAAEVISEIPTDSIIMPKVTGKMIPTNSTYKNFLTTVKKLNKKITAAKDESFSLGNVQVMLFTSKEEHDNLNNYSVLVKVIDGENSFLITGDCEKEEEKEMLEQGFDLSATVLKAAHHGSRTGSSADFIEAVNPRYAVVSCGKDNKYGHPHEETVKRLKKQTNNNYYITADNGTIVFSSDGKNLSVETEK